MKDGTKYTTTNILILKYLLKTYQSIYFGKRYVSNGLTKSNEMVKKFNNENRV